MTFGVFNFLIIYYCKWPFKRLICLFKDHDEIMMMTNKGSKPNFNGICCLRCGKREEFKKHRWQIWGNPLINMPLTKKKQKEPKGKFFDIKMR